MSVKRIVADGEKGDETQQLVREPYHTLQARLPHAQGCAELSLLLRLHLLQLHLQPAAQGRHLRRPPGQALTHLLLQGHGPRHALLSHVEDHHHGLGRQQLVIVRQGAGLGR